MKLFLQRAAWSLWIVFILVAAVIYGLVEAMFSFFTTAYDVIIDCTPALPAPDNIEDVPLYLETEAFFDRESSPLEPASETTSAPTPKTKYKQPGLQYVQSGDEDIPVIVASAPIGYRVTGVDNPNIVGDGSSITIAKYDFLTSYNRWKASHKLIGSYFEEN